MAVVRHLWMFRTAAVVSLLLGLAIVGGLYAALSFRVLFTPRA